jgi:hypothetical protein
MPDFYQKECPIDGPQDPVPTGHMGSHFSIPRKCKGCRFYFEGGCRKITNRRVRLDYGFCGIEGSKELVSDPRAKRRIPLKCVTCPFLKEVEVFGLVCTKDQEVWGAKGRGLDY